jgi:hypothetical protein
MENSMKRRLQTYFVAALLAGGAIRGFSQSADSYQVTGPVLELTDKKIVVQKGKDKWELARDASTKVDGDLKVGSKVTIHYRMTAVHIEAKPDKASKSDKSSK